MSVTLADCLKLPSLRDSVVMGGSKGLNKIVSCVSVLEYADFSALGDSQLFLGNELIISALISIKDDVDAQCELIRRLHEMGEICLVLYYVGIYVPRVDEKLIKTADSLDFPLIMMPPGRRDHRYSEAIAEVMTAIFNDQNQEAGFVESILDQIAQVKPHRRNVSVAMRMISDRLMCSLLLADRNGNHHSFAPWPMSALWDENDLQKLLKCRQSQDKFDEPVVLEIANRSVRMLSTTFDTDKHKGLILLASDENGHISYDNIRQASKALELYANIWDDDFKSDGPDALVRAILNNSPGEMRRAARQLCVDVESIDAMWVLWDKKQLLGEEQKKNNKERMAASLTAYLKERHRTVLVDVFSNCIVAFMDMPRFSRVENSSATQFMDDVGNLRNDFVLFCASNLLSTQQARDTFTMFEDNVEAACKIYPHQSILTKHELAFARRIKNMAQNGEELDALLPLEKSESSNETLDTLITFLLDCQCGIIETSQLLYVHKNTVKYRIKKAQAILGIELMKMPEIMDIYVCAALKRFTKQ